MNELLVFYGNNVIRDGPWGLDVSRCQHLVVRIERLSEKSLQDVRRCIRREFDRETACKKMIIEIVSCTSQDGGSSNLYWHVQKVTGPVCWDGYMQFVTTPGHPSYARPMVYVQFVQKNQLSLISTTKGGAEVEDNLGEGTERELVINEDAGPFWSARIDCFEVIPSMPNELDSEEEGTDEDMGDVGGNAISVRAVGRDMDDLTLQALVISPDGESRWAFDENTLRLGQRYPNKHAAQIAISNYAVSIHREYKTKRSDPDCLKVLCTHPDCPARIRVSRRAGICKDFEITVLVDHTCQLSEPLTRHRQVSVKYVAEKVYKEVSENLSVPLKTLMSTVADEVGFSVSYDKVKRAKQMVIESLFGTFDEAYTFVPRLLHQIAEANPGTYINRLDRPHPDGVPGRFILDRVFWSFSQTISAFRYCRPVLSMDVTFLTGKYKGTLLIAMTADANDQILPVAYAIVESENSDSWLWFLTNVKNSVVTDIPNVCVISDRNAGLLHAIDTIKNSQWSDLESKFCMRHLAANFFKKFKTKDLMKTFKKLCSQNQLRKFRELWTVLDEATSSYSGDTRNAAEEQVSRGAGATRRVRNLSEWVSRHAPELDKWALVHDTDGRRFGIMTTNMS